MRLNSVVLPAPLGPMMLVMLPRSMTRSTALTATRPPNRLVTPRAMSSEPPAATSGAEGCATASGGCRSSSIGVLGLRLLVQLGATLLTWEDPFRAEHHHEHESQPVDHELGATQINRLQWSEADEIADLVQPI